jgi:hypothetical protein
MIDPTANGRSVSVAPTMLSRGGTRQPPQTQTFASALSGELDSRDATAPLPCSKQRASEAIATRQNPGTGTATSTSPPEPAQNPIEALISAYDSGISAAAATTGSAATTESTQSPPSFDQTYWASQPAAVQQLENVNPADRTELATQLANEGYSIDVPIMVWGWDPATTMAARQADGYTWVPSALQQPVDVAPGLTFNGQSYNPANPPPGSIAVT